jgi:hypothetical protein
VAGHVSDFGSGYFSFSYSALASFRMGMLGSASFQRARKSWQAVRAPAMLPHIDVYESEMNECVQECVSYSNWMR